jgi:hypothetical protein
MEKLSEKAVFQMKVSPSRSHLPFVRNCSIRTIITSQSFESSSPLFEAMLLASILRLVSALQNCSSPVEYLYNVAGDFSVPDGGWFFFYSDHILLGDHLTVRLRPNVSEAKLYKGDGLFCPSGSDSAIATVSPGNWGKASLAVSSDLGLQLFGITATTATGLVVSVSGDNPNTADLSTWLVLTSLFLAATIVLLVALFVHAIMARGRVHYQVDLNE